VRYIINDDCLEDWYRYLSTLNKEVKDSRLEYVIEEIEGYIENQTSKQFLNRLREINESKD
jgi:hypothetical protein